MNQQEYINELQKIQCCFQELAKENAINEFLGKECLNQLNNIKLLYSILYILTYQNVENNNCLENYQINQILEKSKIICKNCNINLI